MSLNFSLTEIENWQELWLPVKDEEEMKRDMWGDYRQEEDGSWVKLSVVTHSLIFRTMVVGIGSITKKTAPEFYARCVIFERLFDSTFVYIDGEPVAIKPEWVWRHVGLSTNVGTESWTVWRNRMFQQARSDHEHDYNKWLPEAGKMETGVITI